MPHGKTVVILGAGFGGVHVAEELSRLLPEKTECKIILVDRNNFSLFTPMLPEAASGEVDVRDVVCPVRHLSPRISFQQGRVDNIDLTSNSVVITSEAIEDGVQESSRTLQADHVVIALGSVTNFHDLPGVREQSVAVKSLGDAAAIRDRVLALLERANSEADESERCALLTVVVGGGGFSGVETIAAVNDLLRDGARSYPRVQPEDVHAELIHPGDRLLPELGEELASYAKGEMEKRGITVTLNTEISEAGDGYVQIKDGRRIRTHLLIWAAGVMPSPVVASLDCKRGRHGGIVVDECCAVPDHPGVWALGDCAEIPQPNDTGSYAPTAQNAIREGSQVARNIVAVLGGNKPRPFVYKPIGELAIVGKRTGVARIYGRNFSGPLAWVLWRGIYLMKMPSIKKRLRIALDWCLDMAFGRDIAVLPTRPSTET